MSSRQISLMDFIQNDNKDGMEQDDLNFNCWLVEDKVRFHPLADSKIQKKITPGIYEVKEDPRSGEIYAELKNEVSDDLLRFNNSVIDEILKDVDNFWSNKDKFTKMHILHKRGILLSGAPGTGKSCAITLISNYIKERKGVVFNTTPRNFLNTMTLLTSAFRKIEKDKPVVVIMEDIDQFDKPLIPYLLDFLDGKNTIENIMIVMTSNNTTCMSPAILRPGRTDKEFVVPELSSENRKMYFESKGFEGEELDNLITKSEGLNISQCKTLLISYSLGEDLDEAVEYLKTPIEQVNYMEDNDYNSMQM